MRVAFLCLSLPLMMLAGTACAGEEDLGCTADTQCREGRVCMDNACAPDTSRRDHEFFGQFVHEVSGTHVTGMSYIYDGEGGHWGFQLNVFLLADGGAVVFYGEGLRGIDFTLRDNNNGANPTRITTSWSIIDDKVIVGDVLICTGKPAEHRRTVDSLPCVVQRTIVDERTAGMEVVLKNDFRGPTSPDDERFSEFADE